MMQDPFETKKNQFLQTIFAKAYEKSQGKKRRLSALPLALAVEKKAFGFLPPKQFTGLEWGGTRWSEVEWVGTGWNWVQGNGHKKMGTGKWGKLRKLRKTQVMMTP